MSQPREVPETEGGDRCHRDGWHGLMAQTDVPATENQDGWPIHLSLSVLCVCVCVFLSWGHPSVSFVLAFAVCETDVLDMRRKVCFLAIR